MSTLNLEEKHAMFQRAKNNNPGLTFDAFEKKLEEHRSSALKKANPNAQHFRTLNDMIIAHKSLEDMSNVLSESDTFDRD